VNPVFIVSDNNCYGTITQHHDARYPGRPYQAATQLTNPDFAMWATAFGAKGMTIHEESEVESVIEAALAVKTQPVVIHVHTSLQQISAWRKRS
jgi:acetolactate synthase-1/2/3 large subunit